MAKKAGPYLNGIDKLWTFEVEGSKWAKGSIIP